MTKAEIIKQVIDKVGLTQNESQEIVEDILNSMKEALIEGESVKIPGFGTFIVRSKVARRGRNPQTGEEVEITPRRVISFKASNLLKAIIEDKQE